jgi:hypothetical protein
MILDIYSTISEIHSKVQKFTSEYFLELQQVARKIRKILYVL